MIESNALTNVIGKKILVVDDDDFNQSVLKSMLEINHHEVFSAYNGKQAIEQFSKNNPDLILMDVVMPVMDGYEAARVIKKNCCDIYIPIIFLTALTNEKDLAMCVAAGGDDFLSKPFSQVILNAKISAQIRMIDLYNTSLSQRYELNKHNQYLEQEQLAAVKIFNKIIDSEYLNNNNIKYHISPMSLFNGDMLLVAPSSGQSTNVIVGDATGHGLPASIGTIPLADIFYTMSKKGITLKRIVASINTKLHHILPGNIFCCACFLNICPTSMTLTYWNGGLPDGIIYNDIQGEIREMLRSKNLPLGISDGDVFSCAPVEIKLRKGDRIYLFSDGVVETCNINGELFGSERLAQCFAVNTDPSNLFDEILVALKKFSQEHDQTDDITLLEYYI